jgi:hypothetical protein
MSWIRRTVRAFSDDLADFSEFDPNDRPMQSGLLEIGFRLAALIIVTVIALAALAWSAWALWF